MKKTIISLISACALLLAGVFCARAQDNPEHLTFKGIPIDGNVEEFRDRLAETGYGVVCSDRSITLLEGRFAGYEGCSVILPPTGRAVEHVFVTFPECESWSDVFSNYIQIKKMLTSKYGDPSKCTEEFQAGFDPEGEYEKTLCMKLKKYDYSTLYKVRQGYILLNIATDGKERGYVGLSYIDGTNYAASRAQTAGEAMNDL